MKLINGILALGLMVVVFGAARAGELRMEIRSSNGAPRTVENVFVVPNDLSLMHSMLNRRYQANAVAPLAAAVKAVSGNYPVLILETGRKSGHENFLVIRRPADDLDLQTNAPIALVDPSAKRPVVIAAVNDLEGLLRDKFVWDNGGLNFNWAVQGLGSDAKQIESAHVQVVSTLSQAPDLSELVAGNDIKIALNILRAQQYVELALRMIDRGHVAHAVLDDGARMARTRSTQLQALSLDRFFRYTTALLLERPLSVILRPLASILHNLTPFENGPAIDLGLMAKAQDALIVIGDMGRFSRERDLIREYYEKLDQVLQWFLTATDQEILLEGLRDVLSRYADQVFHYTGTDWAARIRHIERWMPGASRVKFVFPN